MTDVGVNSTDDDTKDEDESDDTASADTEAGLTLFENSCLSCHGNQGTGGHSGPDLQISEVASDKNAIIKRIKNGGSSMLAFEELLTQEEIKSIAEYVTVISPLGK